MWITTDAETLASVLLDGGVDAKRALLRRGLERLAVDGNLRGKVVSCIGCIRLATRLLSHVHQLTGARLGAWEVNGVDFMYTNGGVKRRWNGT